MNAVVLATTTIFALLAGAFASAEPTDRVVVRAIDNGEPLVNPGMGWKTMCYSNLLENYPRYARGSAQPGIHANSEREQ